MVSARWAPPAAAPPGGGAGAPGLDHLRVIGQAEVVVGTEGQQLAAVDLDQRPLRRIEQGSLPVETGGAAFGEASGEIERHGNHRRSQGDA